MTNYIGGTSIFKTEDDDSITHSIAIDYRTDFTADNQDELKQFKKKYNQNPSLKFMLLNFKQILLNEVAKIEKAIESEEIIYVETKGE